MKYLISFTSYISMLPFAIKALIQNCPFQILELSLSQQKRQYIRAVKGTCLSQYEMFPNEGASRGVGILSGETTLSKWFCLLSEKGSTLNGKNLLPSVDSFSERVWYAVMQRGSHKSCPSCTKN